MDGRLWVVAGVLLLLASGVSPQSAPATKPEPEEPDFAFIAGGPYTQLKNSIQIIHQSGYSTRCFPVSGGHRNEDGFLFFLRTEWGITDRLELDVITPGSGSRVRLNGSSVSRELGFNDAIIGVRYRLLSEETARFTLTAGPQVILPTGSVRRGTGNGSPGVAWDVAAAKDWGGPVFLYSSLNYKVLPSADDPTPASAKQFTLHGLQWATALVFRPLERPLASGENRDLHAFFEAGGSWSHEVEPGAMVGSRQGKLLWLVSPGLRYGFLTARKTLVEIGVAAPIGLGPNGPKRGLIVQFQFERLVGKQEN